MPNLLLPLLSALALGQTTVLTMKKGKCTGRAVNYGDTVWFTHVGRVQLPGTNRAGRIFDESGPVPLKLQTLGVGTRRLIKGMEFGMKGMCKGETRQLVIQPRDAYDDTTRIPEANRPVPRGTTVMYEITLVDHIPRGKKGRKKPEELVGKPKVKKQSAPASEGQLANEELEEGDEAGDEGEDDENYDEL